MLSTENHDCFSSKYQEGRPPQHPASGLLAQELCLHLGLDSKEACLQDYKDCADKPRLFCETAKQSSWLQGDLVRSLSVFCESHFDRPCLRESVFRKWRSEISLTCAGLTRATSPDSIGLAEQETHALLVLWMYLVDDSVCAWWERSHADPCFERDIRDFVDFSLQSWRAGLLGHSPPVTGGTRGTRGSDKNKWSTACFELSELLSECATRIRAMAQKTGRTATELYLDSRALEGRLVESLSEKIDEARGAPTNVGSYMRRHQKTGHVKVCVELNRLVLRWLQQDHAKTAEDDTEPTWNRMLSWTDKSVLLSNELFFAKDIGHPEESLLAVVIQDLSEGLIPPSRLSTAMGHGSILSDYAATPLGFQAASYIRDRLMAVLGKLVEEIDSTLQFKAQCSQQHRDTQVVLAWSLGYHFSNPKLPRYASSVPIVHALMSRNEAQFIKEASLAVQQSLLGAGA